MDKNSVICSGLSVSNGIAHGRIKKLVGTNRQSVDKNDIVVLQNSDPTYAVDVISAAGVIMERGGRFAHLCVIALEMGIPCITQVENAQEILTDGQQIILDAWEGKIYAG